MVLRICVIAHISRDPNLGVGKVLFKNYLPLKIDSTQFDYYFSENLFPKSFGQNIYLRTATAPIFTRLIADDYHIANVHGSDCFLVPKKVPCITTFHGIDSDVYNALKSLGPLPKKYELAQRANIVKQKLAIARSQYFFAISNSVRLSIKRQKPEAKVFLTPNGVDTLTYCKKASTDLQLVRKKLHLDSNIPIVLFVGRSHAIKGIHLLNPIIERVVKELGKNVCFVFISSDNQVIKKCIDPSFQDICSFFENLSPNDLVSVYNLATVHIAPSLYEPFGLTGLEAMSCGTPTVAFDVGGFKDYITDGVTGCLVRPFEVEIFAKKILELISNENYKQTISENGRKKALNFDWKKTSDKISHAFNEIISAPDHDLNSVMYN